MAVVFFKFEAILILSMLGYNRAQSMTRFPDWTHHLFINRSAHERISAVFITRDRATVLSQILNVCRYRCHCNDAKYCSIMWEWWPAFLVFICAFSSSFEISLQENSSRFRVSVLKFTEENWMLRLNRYRNLPSVPKFVLKENAKFLNFERVSCCYSAPLFRAACWWPILSIFNFRTCLAQNACEHPQFRSIWTWYS